MKLSNLLSQRETLLRQVRLANLAFAYAKLVEFAARASAANLGGKVTLQHPQPDVERYSATLLAAERHQSVIEEHFDDEDIMELADVVAFLTGEQLVNVTFRIEDVPDKFIRPLRIELQRLGIDLETHMPLTEGNSGTGSGFAPQRDETG